VRCRHRGTPRPDTAATTSLISALATELDAAPRDPGRPLLRRLNRAEYGNVIRDLLAIEVDVRSLLPADDAAFGFDNNADLQATSPALLEKYLVAADKVSALAVGDPTTTPAADNFFTRGDQSQSQHQDGLPLGTVGGIGIRYYFPLDGEYQFQVGLIRTNTEGIRGLELPHQLEISVDGERVFLGTVGGEADSGTGQVTARSDATDARLRARGEGESRIAAGVRRVDSQDWRGNEPAAAVPAQQRWHVRLHRPATREVPDDCGGRTTRRVPATRRAGAVCSAASRLRRRQRRKKHVRGAF
jgi:hypothetical protein